MANYQLGVGMDANILITEEGKSSAVIIKDPDEVDVRIAGPNGKFESVSEKRITVDKDREGWLIVDVPERYFDDDVFIIHAEAKDGSNLWRDEWRAQTPTVILKGVGAETIMEQALTLREKGEQLEAEAAALTKLIEDQGQWWKIGERDGKQETAAAFFEAANALHGVLNEIEEVESQVAQIG